MRSGADTKVLTTKIYYEASRIPKADPSNGLHPPKFSNQIVNPIPKPKRQINHSDTVQLSRSLENRPMSIPATKHGEAINQSDDDALQSRTASRNVSKLFGRRPAKSNAQGKPASQVTRSKSMNALAKLRGVAKFAHQLTVSIANSAAARSRDASPRDTPTTTTASVSLHSGNVSPDFKACAFSYKVYESQSNLLDEITTAFSEKLKEESLNATSELLPSPFEAKPGCSQEQEPPIASVRRKPTSWRDDAVAPFDAATLAAPRRTPAEAAQKSSSFPYSSRRLIHQKDHCVSSKTQPVLVSEDRILENHARSPLYASYNQADSRCRTANQQSAFLQMLDKQSRASMPNAGGFYQPISCCSSSSRGSSPVSSLVSAAAPSENGSSDLYIRGRRRFVRAKTDLGPNSGHSSAVNRSDYQLARLTEREIAKRAQHGPRQVHQLLSEIDASSDSSSIKSHKRRLVYYYTCL